MLGFLARFSPSFLSYPFTVGRLDSGQVRPLHEERAKLVVGDGVDGCLEGFVALPRLAAVA
jgi:hypothetical protein